MTKGPEKSGSAKSGSARSGSEKAAGDTTPAEKTPAKSTDPVELVDHVQVDCEALLGSGQMTIGQLSKLTKGDVVTLDRSPADPVDIRVNGKTIARGEIVTVDDRFAIRLTDIG